MAQHVMVRVGRVILVAHSLDDFTASKVELLHEAVQALDFVCGSLAKRAITRACKRGYVGLDQFR